MLEDRIRQSRLSRGWNQNELAQRMSVAQPTISAWETGTKAPRLKILLRLSEVLGVSMEWLSTGRGSRLPQSSALQASDLDIPEGYRVVSEEEQARLLRCYARLDSGEREALLSLLESVLYRKLSPESDAAMPR